MQDKATILEQVLSSMPPQYREVSEYEAKAMLRRLGAFRDPNGASARFPAAQRRRVALCAALIHPADVLILDEPTNHLDTEMVQWLEELAAADSRAGIVMVTHDRYFLERVVNHITELSRGKLYHYEAELLPLSGAAGAARADGGGVRAQAAVHPARRAGVDPARLSGPQHQEQGAHRPL